MNRVVVDTSVVSYILKQHTLAVHYRKHLEGRLVGISFMSVAELYRWPLLRGWGASKITALKDHLRSYVVLPYDDAMCWEWARLMSVKGRPMDPADAWIAATAIRYQAPLLTHNAKHFLHIEELRVVTADA